jgi:site-specific DNA-methyltransferase (adenine-specific)
VILNVIIMELENFEVSDKLINKIHNMDCIKGLKKIPNNSVDLMIADPPYGISRTLNCKGQKLGTTAKLDFDFGDWDVLNMDWCIEGLKKTKGWAVIFCAKRDLGKYWDILEKMKFVGIDAVVWQKPDPIPLNGKTKFLNAWETAIIGKRSGSYFGGYCTHNIFKYQAPKGKTRFHPTQKPLKLIQEIIELTTPEKGLVLDPFMGSGTTAVASKLSNREYIGFEIDSKYCKQARLRVKNTEKSLLSFT